jgi:hypothetical protein
MSKQNQNQTPKILLGIGGTIYAGGKWKDLDEAISDIITTFNIWKDRRPPQAEKQHTWYCPICTGTEYYSGRKGIPRCLYHNVEMSRYDEEEFSRRRRELAEAAIRDIPKIIPLFARVIEIYSGKQPVLWGFENGEVIIQPDDPTEIRYVRGAIRATFYYCDLERHCEAAKFLREEAARLGFSVLMEFYPPHFDSALFPEAQYDRNKNMFIYKV